MISIRQEKRTDIPAREALLNAAMGEARFTKCSERLREDRIAAEGLSFVAIEDGRLVGTVRCGTSPPVPAGRCCCSARWPLHPTRKAAASAAR